MTNNSECSIEFQNSIFSNSKNFYKEFETNDWNYTMNNDEYYIQNMINSSMLYIEGTQLTLNNVSFM